MSSSILADKLAPQHTFNPANKKDLLELKFFRANKKWKTTCPFILTYPYLEIPSMCAELYTDHMMERLS